MQLDLTRLAASATDAIATTVSVMESSVIVLVVTEEPVQCKPTDQSCHSGFIYTTGSHFTSFSPKDGEATDSTSHGACSDPKAAIRSSVASIYCFSCLQTDPCFATTSVGVCTSTEL